MGMLQKDRTLMAIASLMYAPAPLEDVSLICKSYFATFNQVVVVNLF